MVGRNVMKQRIFTAREWVRRREVANKQWTSDELWAHIRKNWPTMTDKEMEEVYQGAYTHKRRG